MSRETAAVKLQKFFSFKYFPFRSGNKPSNNCALDWPNEVEIESGVASTKTVELLVILGVKFDGEKNTLQNIIAAR